MSVSVSGIISALAMKPMPAMLARSIANNFASLAREAATSAAPAEAGAAAVSAGEPAGGDGTASRLDARA